MGLLVIQVLNAVLHMAQKLVGPRQRVGGVLRHQAGAGHALQRAHRGSHPQFRKLAAAHHLQELHGEFNLPNAAARELDVIGALGVAGAAAMRLFADLPVQAAQRVKHVVVQVAPEDKRQHHCTQVLQRAAPVAGRGLALQARSRCHHPTFEPGKAFPLATLHLKVFFQRAERNGRRAGVAVGPQGQVNTKYKTVFGGVPDQRIKCFDLVRKIFVVGDLAPPVGAPRCLTVQVVHINQVDVTGDIEFTRTELAHAHHPQRGASGVAAGQQGRAVKRVQRLLRAVHGHIQSQFGQLGHGQGHYRQRRGAGARGLTVQNHQPLQHDLAQHPQGGTCVQFTRQQNV